MNRCVTAMHFDIFTLFPEAFDGPLRCSIVGRAIDRGLLSVGVHNIRDYASDRHRVCDDYPYGGGAGMVLKPEPVFVAAESVLNWSAADGEPPCPIVLMTPQGRTLTQNLVSELAESPRLALVCGHYEGVDERIREHLVTDEISIGDYVLTGGELPALIILDAVSRWIPGVLGDEDSVQEDSFANGLIEHPHYTRPVAYRDWTVPEVLRSGDHGEIARWRRQQSLLRTQQRRPDLLERISLTREDTKLLDAQT